MSEPGLDDYIALNATMIQCLACALIGAGVLDPSDIAAVYRRAAELGFSERVESELLAFAESLEQAGARAERPLAKHPAADISACRDRDPASAQPVMENSFLGVLGFKSLPNAEVLFSKSSLRPAASFQLAEQSIDQDSGSTSVRDHAMQFQSRLGYV